MTSPTFVLAREHPTASGVPLVHVDAYRLATGRELDDLDLDYEHAIVVVEWGAGKLDGVSDSWLSIDIGARRATPQSTLSPTTISLATSPAQVTVTGHGPRGLELEAALATRD